MADPAFIDLPSDEWTKIATNVTTGQVHLVNTDPNIIKHTYRDNGSADDPLVTDPNGLTGTPVFVGTIIEQIQSSVGIDVYLFPVKKASRVRVDL